MRSAVSICLAAAFLFACGSERRDWRIPACQGESSETCRLDHVELDGEPRSFLLSQPPGSDCPDGLPRDDTNGFTGWNRDPDGDDLRFFDAMLEVLGREPCIDTTRLFSVGHSRGGRFVEVLACQRAGTHLALAWIAAGAWNVSTCPGRAPLWIAHGRSDATVGFWQGKLLRGAWARRNGCDPVLFFERFEDGRCTALPGCAAATPVVWCPHEETLWDGHGVPGFASAAIWSFFESRLVAFADNARR